MRTGGAAALKRRRVIDIPARIAAKAPAALLVGASALLLIAVGWGDALRFYPRLMAERAAVLAATLSAPIAAYGETGLPISDFTGFEPRARAARAAAPEIAAIAFRDGGGATLFHHPAGVDGRTAGPGAGAPGDGIALQGDGAPILGGRARLLSPSDDRFLILSPVTNRFGEIGRLEVSIDRAALEARVADRMAPLRLAAPALCLLVLVALAAAASRDRRRDAARAETIAGVAFAIFAGAVFLAVLDLYRDAAQSKMSAVAASLADRIGAATEIGLDPRAFSGVEDLVGDYLSGAGDLSRVALFADGALVAEAERAELGLFQDWGVASRAETAASAGAPVFEAVVEAPATAMLQDLWRAGRNFLVLFIACAVAGYMLIGLGGAFGARAPPASEATTGAPASTAPAPDVKPADAPAAFAAPAAQDAGGAGLARIRGLYFLAVGMDSLVASFLPRLAAAAAADADAPFGAAGWPFTAYFVALAVALIPAAQLTGRGRMRLALTLGAALSAGGFCLLWLGGTDLATLVAARATTGAGQGVLLVAVQAYAFASVPASRRTAAAAVQVFAFNAGFLCGASIGGMLFDYTSAATVFAVGAATGGAVVLLSLTASQPQPAAPAREPVDATPPVRREGAAPPKLGSILSDRNFLMTLGLVGALSKFILAGVVMFAAPLLFAARGWSADSIGQMLMVFAVATLAAIPLSARIADRGRAPWRVLVAGALTTATGLLCLALPGALRAFADPGGAAAFLIAPGGAAAFQIAPGGAAEAALSLAGLVLLGLGQGATAAPLIAEVASAPVAAGTGRDRTLAVYRLSERAGHIAGPAVIARLGAPPTSLGLMALGLTAALFAALYGLWRRSAAATRS